MGIKVSNDLGDGWRYEIELHSGFFWAAVIGTDEEGVELRLDDSTAYLTMHEARWGVDRLLDAFARGRVTTDLEELRRLMD